MKPTDAFAAVGALLTARLTQYDHFAQADPPAQPLRGYTNRSLAPGAPDGDCLEGGHENFTATHYVRCVGNSYASSVRLAELVVGTLNRHLLDSTTQIAASVYGATFPDPDMDAGFRYVTTVEATHPVNL